MNSSLRSPSSVPAPGSVVLFAVGLATFAVVIVVVLSAVDDR
jgi:hypothetical protein